MHIGRQDAMANVARLGDLWVPFFFTLSGFLSGRSCHAHTPTAAWSHLKKLYPMHAIGLCLSLAAGTSAPLWTWLSNVLLIQTWVYPYGVGSPNAVSWYVSCLLAYDLFAWPVRQAAQAMCL